MQGGGWQVAGAGGTSSALPARAISEVPVIDASNPSKEPRSSAWAEILGIPDHMPFRISPQPTFSACLRKVDIDAARSAPSMEP